MRRRIEREQDDDVGDARVGRVDETGDGLTGRDRAEHRADVVLADEVGLERREIARRAQALTGVFAGRHDGIGDRDPVAGGEVTGQRRCVLEVCCGERGSGRRDAHEAVRREHPRRAVEASFAAQQVHPPAARRDEHVGRCAVGDLSCQAARRPEARGHVRVLERCRERFDDVGRAGGRKHRDRAPAGLGRAPAARGEHRSADDDGDSERAHQPTSSIEPASRTS